MVGNKPADEEETTKEDDTVSKLHIQFFSFTTFYYLVRPSPCFDLWPLTSGVGTGEGGEATFKKKTLGRQECERCSLSAWSMPPPPLKRRASSYATTDYTHVFMSSIQLDRTFLLHYSCQSSHLSPLSYIITPAMLLVVKQGLVHVCVYIYACVIVCVKAFRHCCLSTHSKFIQILLNVITVTNLS